MSKALLALKSQVEKRKAELQTQNRTKKWKRIGDQWKEEDKIQEQETFLEAHSPIESKQENGTETSNKEPPLLKEEVIERLRAWEQPATLFGETDYERYIRLRDLELRNSEESKGQRNIFQQKLRQFKEKDELENFYRVTEMELPSKGSAAQKVKEEIYAAEEGPEFFKTPEEYCFRYMRRLLKMWKAEVEQLDEETKRTSLGRKTLATFEQTKEYLKPLFRKLKKQQLDKSILTSLEKILRYVEQREYVLANDEYLRLAIGNAPWPVGATMVGIHARTAREKISEGKIAHVMNDEETRKYIQAVKRLITLSQKWYPTVPSKMVVG
ncbi:Pre-mRNA-splicing factor 18 [Galdieria sulphuraria]|uniref:Pre-mRNA-splicing factor 18 n=1 Tax=Galdieria sulphuraria TaxID=130081 RepID=M2XS56_GALSU|nr:pre-mRNA-splicing factor 18 [Galdieria sulphuraria]EME26498.1 pre-mRNA-splicing factor 18 [Galdieria sulphuraria]GJD10026.1 Pre-mRNA-splicing factor 18 [Galdieria sulphuraria]|eukprot:XP_005703018.1 pre-mRNA-splicing factor 18 [Galdieria sulphuraria]